MQHVNSSGLTTCSPAANYSFNPSPDIIAKVAFEPGFGHYEVFGIYSRFRDRVFPCGEVSSTSYAAAARLPVRTLGGATNSSKNGGGVGANARWSFDNKHIDFGLHGLTGRGSGPIRHGWPSRRVGSWQRRPRPDSLLSGPGTLEWHSQKLDVYFNGGAEYAGRAAGYDPIENKFIGYGSPNFPSKGCYTETAPVVGGGFFPGGLSSCTADTRVLIEGTAGYWYRIYTGPKGRLQYGIQYSYVARDTWHGSGFTPGIGVSPSGLDNMVFTSFRYYLP